MILLSVNEFLASYKYLIECVINSSDEGKKKKKLLFIVWLYRLPQIVYNVLCFQCHETRSLDDNRKRARQILQEKLDNFLHGENSFSALQKAERAAKLEKKKSKSQKRLDMKRTFKMKKDDWLSLFLREKKEIKKKNKRLTFEGDCLIAKRWYSH